jgi:hypothetical protein
MVEFYYNWFINEATSHLPFEFMYGFQPSTLADRLLPLTSATVEAADRLTIISGIRDVVTNWLSCRRNEYQLDRLGLLLCFNRTKSFYLSTKGLNIWSHKCKHLRDYRLGPFNVICKVGIYSYKLLIPKGCRLHHVFHCDLLSHASSSTSLRPHQA